MNGKRTAAAWLQLLLILVIGLSLAVLLLLPPGSPLAWGLWVWLAALVILWMVWMLLTHRLDSEEADGPRHELGPRMLHPDDQPQSVHDLMDVRIALEEQGVLTLRGPLRRPPEEVFEELKRRLPPSIVPMLQEDERLGAVIVLMPRPLEQARLERPARRLWLHWLLFGLTVLTTTWAGALHQGINLLQEPERFAIGLAYSLPLLAMLGLHELGHYFTARHHGMNVTPPFFIPVPFALGTFGAFIQMRSPPENRRVLFDVAVAGPLAGLVVAIPALWFGLQTSEVLPPERDPGPRTLIGLGTRVDSSVIMALVAKAAIPEALEEGCTLRLSPMAFAGWLGLLVTALNLLPIGQLDGGHIARAMFGHRVGELISGVAMWSLFLLALFVWPALLLFAIIVFFLAGRGSPPLNDLSRITSERRLLGIVAFVILASILVPIPAGLGSAIGLRCPYL